MITSVDRFIWLALLICSMNLFSCSESTEKKDPTKVEETTNYVIQKPGSSFSDTLVINKKSAVFFSPDSLQLEKIGKVYSPMAFESAKHDCLYQMGVVRSVMKTNSPGIAINETKKQRYILFVKEDGQRICLDTDKLDFCGVILFDRKKDPQVADMTNIDTALRYYFDL